MLLTPGSPLSPLGPWIPCSPVSPLSPLSPLGPFKVPVSNLAWKVCPSANVIWLALPVSLVTYPLKSTSPPLLKDASAILLLT